MIVTIDAEVFFFGTWIVYFCVMGMHMTEPAIVQKKSSVGGLIRLASSRSHRNRRKNYDDILPYELLVLLRF